MFSDQAARQRYPDNRDGHNTEEPTALEIRMRQILSEADFPAISKDALDALRATPDDDASLQRLANIVLRDYALTLKVLRTANSAYYKRGKPVQSATHAMLLLGARTVRHLAGSIMMFDHYRKRSPGLKELMLMSMITANHAREIGHAHRHLILFQQILGPLEFEGGDGFLGADALGGFAGRVRFRSPPLPKNASETHRHRREQCRHRDGERRFTPAPAPEFFGLRNGPGVDGLVVEEPTEFVGEVAGRGEALARFLLQAFQTEGFQVAWDAGDQQPG